MLVPSVHRSSRLVRRLAHCLLLGAITAPAGAGPSYTFVNIADDTGPFSSSFSQAVINNNGTVAFGVGIGGGDTGIFTGNGGPLTTIVLGGDGNYNVSNLIGMNDHDLVAVRVAESILEEGVWTGDGGPLSLVVTSDENPFQTCGGPDINTPGQVVFHGIVVGGTSGLHRAQGFGNYTTIADTSGDFVSFGGQGSINDSGTVAFYAADSVGFGIYTGDGGPLTTIVETVSTAFTSLGTTVSVNNAGTVAFFAGNSSTQGVYTGNGGPITTIADSDGAFAQFTFNDVCINNNGDVAFIATPDSGPRGIFTGPDVVADRVIQIGDPLFGSTLAGVSSVLGAHAINDDGAIAFEYFLADGRSGIAVAAPLQGDANGDTVVDVTDLLIVLDAWGPCLPPCPPFCTGDVNEDCTVDVTDLLLVLANWS
ncbi:MAG: DUF7453 family protein [Planctomycetota bacterium]|jgi:hypothetical protein